MEIEQSLTGEEVPIAKASKKRKKKVVSGMILDVQTFKNQAQCKNLSVKIINSLEECGLLRLCTFNFAGYFKKEVTQFYLHAKIENNSVVSKVGDVDVCIDVNDFRKAFGFHNSELSLENHEFDLDEFWGEIRREDAPADPKINGKRCLLKEDYCLLLDIISKCIETKFSSRDSYNHEELILMNAILSNKRMDWGAFVFTKFCEQIAKATPLVNGWLRQEIGYGFAVGEILKNKRVHMSKPESIKAKFLFRSNPTPTPKDSPVTAKKPARKRKSVNIPTQAQAKAKKTTIREPSIERSNNLTDSLRTCSHPLSTPDVPALNPPVVPNLESIDHSLPLSHDHNEIRSEEDVPVVPPDKLNAHHKQVYERLEMLLQRLRDSMKVEIDTILAMFRELGERETQRDAKLDMLEQQMKTLIQQLSKINDIVVDTRKHQIDAGITFQRMVAHFIKGKGAPSHSLPVQPSPPSQASPRPRGAPMTARSQGN